MEYKGSLLCSQDTTTGLYSEPVQFSSHPPTLFFKSV